MIITCRWCGATADVDPLSASVEDGGPCPECQARLDDEAEPVNHFIIRTEE
jgi:hypothetical protein